MIVELVVRAVKAVAVFVAGLFPTLELPSWWDTIGGHVSELASDGAGFGAWFPFGAAISAAGVVFAAVLVAVGIKLVRVLASFLTAGGGSAA